MKKLLQSIDSLPVIRLLQLGAIAILVFGLARIFPIWGHVFYAAQFNAQQVLNALLLTLFSLGRTLFEPLVLLGLAELIRQRRV